jgi:hypothetical protein
MKAVTILCKTAGFKYGDTPEIGKGKGKLSLEEAEDLVAKGLAKEVKVVVVGKSNETDLEKANADLVLEKANFETKIADLEKANADLVLEKANFETKIADLEKATAKTAKTANAG